MELINKYLGNAEAIVGDECTHEEFCLADATLVATSRTGSTEEYRLKDGRHIVVQYFKSGRWNAYVGTDPSLTVRADNRPPVLAQDY